MTITDSPSSGESEVMPTKALPRAAPDERGSPRLSTAPFRSAADARAFFAACDAREGSGIEPDWEEHRKVIGESRSRGVPTAAKRVDAGSSS